ncbi:FeS cluster assembly protein sufB [Candidatus Hodgkinia cicadicola]|uniref:FeS cluster assembly protein sufB n=1 Tax=Candidatus Hodgkinia cicadicola TaxID=573658 RepID=A0ABX4MH52_9HYPH|nr:FeS cluster assembly protein sufB [Candidatus Hodgkinia cicadicola]
MLFYCWLFMCFPIWSKIGFNCKEIIKEYNISSNQIKIKNKQLLDIDIIHNSSSVYLSMTKELKKLNVYFSSLSIATLLNPIYVRRYLGSVISHNDNYFSALNTMLFTDGTFIIIPKNIKIPTVLTTYFRIDRNSNGQFERTLIILEDQSSIGYFEGCNSNITNTNTLHTAVVEIIVKRYSCLRYSTFQNWFNEKNGILNFVSKRALCYGEYSKIVWIQIEIGAIVTWKYPSSILLAKNSSTEFHSLSVSNLKQCIDTGTKVYHIRDNTNSTILSKSIAYGSSTNIFRILVNINKENCKNIVKCNTLLWSENCMSCSLPTIEVNCVLSTIEYESISSYITKSQLNYCKCRGLTNTDTLRLIINGHIYDILRYLPIAISSEITKLFFNNND